MFKFSFVFLLASSLLSGMAQSSSGGNPKIVFTNPIFKFGEIDRGKEVTTRFKFKNEGTGKLVLTDITTSCGCTSATPEKKSYAPGENGEIEVRFDSTRFSGPVTKEVTVSSNDPKSPRTILKLEGNIVTEILSKPEQVFMAKAHEGETTESLIMVSTTRLPKLEISNIKAMPEYLTATPTRIDDQNIEIKLTADGRKFPPGQVRLRGAVEFETNGETQPKVLTNVTINVVSPIGIHPRYVMFWATPQGKKREMTIRLVSHDDKAFEIESIESDKDFVKVERVNAAADDTAFKVVLVESAPEGQFKGSITVKTTHPSQKKIVIPVRGSVLKSS